MMTDNHEVIFAIVNSGFAEDVMDVAREQGVRGGTLPSGTPFLRRSPTPWQDLSTKPAGIPP